MINQKSVYKTLDQFVIHIYVSHSLISSIKIMCPTKATEVPALRIFLLLLIDASKLWITVPENKYNKYTDTVNTSCDGV